MESFLKVGEVKYEKKKLKSKSDSGFYNKLFKKSTPK